VRLSFGSGNSSLCRKGRSGERENQTENLETTEQYLRGNERGDTPPKGKKFTSRGAPVGKTSPSKDENVDHFIKPSTQRELASGKDRDADMARSADD